MSSIISSLEGSGAGTLALAAAAGVGLFTLGYMTSSWRHQGLGRGISVAGHGKPGVGGVAKSYYGGIDSVEKRIHEYCSSNSSPFHPVQEQLLRETIDSQKMYFMMGAPEVLRLNAAIIKAIDARKVLDIGVFTGASCLAAALAMPDDGYVIGCDVSSDYADVARRYLTQAGVDSKVDIRVAPAVDTLRHLIETECECDNFDFAFIDADKPNYDTYYELCLKLLRPGGVIAIDNTLWNGLVIDENAKDDYTMAFKRLNAKMARDTDRVYVVQLKIADGLTIVVKL